MYDLFLMGPYIKSQQGYLNSGMQFSVLLNLYQYIGDDQLLSQFFDFQCKCCKNVLSFLKVFLG